MTVQIALLRGINVGGSGKLAMASLRAILEDMGFENVATYVQSGNAVFSGPAADAKKISEAIRVAAGFAPHAVVLPAKELQAIAKNNPFKKEAEKTPRFLHAFFLDEKPSAASLAALAAIDAPGERFAAHGKVLYYWPPNGLGQSNLAGRIERTLKTVATARNWRTVTALIAMAKEIG